jgi:hypothetical protein
MKLKADGLGASEIADALKIRRSSVYRVLERVRPFRRRRRHR